MPVTLEAAPPPHREGNFATSNGRVSKAETRADGSLLITGVVSDGAIPDCDGETVDVDKSWPYIQARIADIAASSRGKSAMPLRLQHDAKKPCGHVTKLWRNGDQILIEAVVEDPQAVQWVKSGTLSQLSFGGRYVDKEYVSDGVWSVTVDPLEISLVDRGCSVNAHITDIQENAHPADLGKVLQQAREAVRAAAAKCACLAGPPGSAQADRAVVRDQEKTNFDKGDLPHMSKHCVNCATKAARASEFIRRAAALHGQMEECAKAGHPSTYADAQEQGAASTRNENGYGTFVEPAKAASGDFYKRIGLNSDQLEASGGLQKA
jgi:hypothetical protein